MKNKKNLVAVNTFNSIIKTDYHVLAQIRVLEGKDLEWMEGMKDRRGMDECVEEISPFSHENQLNNKLKSKPSTYR